MKVKKTKPKRSLFRKIINTFIGLFGVIIFLGIIFLGFSQTSTFRNFLRNKIVEYYSDSFNGKIQIEKINGSLFSSLIFENTSIINGKDTIFTAHHIEIKINPIFILTKKIYARDINLEDVKINVLQNAKGNWNISNLVKRNLYSKTSNLKNKKVSRRAFFPFIIQVNNLNFKNISFTHQNFVHLGSDSVYSTLNLDDLRITHLNLSARALIDLNKPNFIFEIENYSASLNLKYFKLNKLSGIFRVTNNFVNAENVKIVTDSSSLMINASLKNINLFGKLSLKKFKKYPLKLDVTARPFSFKDLLSFVPSTNMLAGKANLHLIADGEFGRIKIKKLNVRYLNTRLNAVGTMFNLNTPKKLFLNISFKNSFINESNAVALLPKYDIPNFDNLTLANVKLKFYGKPTKFKTKIESDIGKGKIKLDGWLNIEGPQLVYNFKYNFKNLNIKKIISKETNLNLSGNIKGRGLAPSSLKVNFDLTMHKSKFDGYNIDSLAINTISKARKITLNLNSLVNGAQIFTKGKLDFTNKKFPAYNLQGFVKNLNLAKFSDDSTLSSKLNFSFDAVGKDLKLDNMIGNFHVKLNPSVFRDEKINNANLKLVLWHNDKKRRISFTSNLVDFNVNGDFSLEKAISLMNYESSTIGSILKRKLYQLNPAHVINSSHFKIESLRKLPKDISLPIAFKYNFNFKSFRLISIVFGVKEIDIKGGGSGQVKSDSSNFSISSNVKVNYFFNYGNKNSSQGKFYLSNLNADINFSRNNQSIAFKNLFGSLSLSIGKIYFGNNLKNLNADLVFNQNKLYYDLMGDLFNKLHIESGGNISMTPTRQLVKIRNLLIGYNGVNWRNDSTIVLSFSPEYLQLKNLLLKHKKAFVKLNGIISRTGKQNISLIAGRIPGKILTKIFLNEKKSNFRSSVNFTANITGNLLSPVIEASFTANNLGFDNIKFGNLICRLNYKNKNLNTYLRFINSKLDFSNPLLSIDGNIPINLSLRKNKLNVLINKEVSLELKSTKFNLASFGDLLPFIKKPTGILSTNLKIHGTLPKLLYDGYLTVSNGSFVSTLNNMGYKYGLNINFNGNKVKATKIEIRNRKSSKYNGVLNGNGLLKFNGFKLENANLTFKGDLAILNKDSREATKNIYGNLFVGTGGDWHFTYNKGKSNFKGTILIKKSNLTILPKSETTSISQGSIIYKIVTDSSRISYQERKFKELVSAIEKAKLEKELRATTANFNYDIKVKLVNDTKLVLLLSPVWNQKLVIETKGEMEFARINGRIRTQGTLELQPGSKLEFVKTFDARGNITFESDITDPYLNVTAAYQGPYNEGTVNNPKMTEVEVELKLAGLLSKLGTNLMKNPQDISIYKGVRNIQNKIRDNQYDLSDAILFIYIGRFKNDLTAQDKSNLAGLGSTATSFLGSALTSLINSAVGDLVSNIQVNQTEAETKIIVSGRLQNIRYSFGGSTRIQNINEADIKIEYQLLPNLLFRLERKDPIIRSFGTEEKIDEIGLKYKIEF